MWAPDVDAVAIRLHFSFEMIGAFNLENKRIMPTSQLKAGEKETSNGSTAFNCHFRIHRWHTHIGRHRENDVFVLDKTHSFVPMDTNCNIREISKMLTIS